MKNKKMSVFLSMLLLVAMLMSALVGCEPTNDPVEGTDESTIESTDSTDPVGTESDTETNSVSETEAETTNPTEEREHLVKKRITTIQLGMRVAEYENSNPDALSVETAKDYIILYGYEAGTAELKFTDYFGHTASATVTVDAENKKMNIEVKKCEDDFIEVGLDFQAVGNAMADDTKAFQNAIDSAKPGETVYVYPGRYNVTLIVMREGVTLKLYTTMTDATKGFTDELANDFKNNRIAILSGTRIQNNEHQAKGAEGCSNFTITGGGFDNNHTTRSTLIFGCADNVRVENVIFKDMKGNHTIQLTGCTNSIVENCIFAGYTCGDTFTREIIQVEPSTPGATGTAVSAPLKFADGEYNNPENITIQGCYFGKSDEAGAPLISIGHHSQVGKANVTGFYIKNNIFDEVLYAAIRYDNIVDVEISGNTFISSAEYKNAAQFDQATTPAFIVLYHHNGASTYTASDGKKVTKATAVEQAGLHNIKIENNTFTLKAGSDKQIIVYTKRSYVPGVTYTEVTRQDKYDQPTYSFSGYTLNNNFASDISFSSNTINIEGQPAYRTAYISLDQIYRLKFENNTINLADGVRFTSNTNGYEKGQSVALFAPPLEDRIVITTQRSEKTITVKCGDTSYIFSPQYTGTLTFDIGDGGTYDMTDDGNGNIIITVTLDEGYSLDKAEYSDGIGTVSPGVISLADTKRVVFSFKK